RKRARVSGKAAGTPSSKSMATTSAATLRLSHAAWRTSQFLAIAAYQRSDHPCGGNVRKSDALNDVITTRTLGNTRASSETTQKTANTAASSMSPGGAGARLIASIAAAAPRCG